MNALTTATDRYSPARLALVLLALLAPGIAGADAGETAGRPRLAYAEPLVASWPVAQQAPGKDLRRTDSSTLRFNAFGRSFDLALRPNDRLGPPRPGYSLHKGAIASVPGSWARITRHGRSLTGLFFDGHDYFGIEPVANLRELLDPEVPVPPGDNLVYRLSDLLIEPGALACGLEASTGPVTAAAAVSALAAELSTPEMAAAIGPTRRVRLAPVADVEFSSLYGSNADAQILARLNVVDGIFTDQVGVDVEADEPTVFTSTAPPYSLTSTTAQTLLDQLSDYRLETREQAGITHLFTGKRLQNNLVGIAWQDSVCLAREGAGLSSSAVQSANISALIAAHEIGHNMGAPHDGESGSACASTPTTFLMAGQVSGSSVFSACSLQQMAPLITQRASSYPNCLTRLYDYDVAVSAPASRSVAPGTDLSLAITVRNDGTQPTSSVSWQLVTPPDLLIVSVTPAYDSCTSTGNRADCNIATLDGESSWESGVVLRSDVERRYSVETSVSAPTDEQLNNNSARITVTVGQPDSGGSGGGGAIDIGVMLTLALASLMRGPAQRRAAAMVMTLAGALFAPAAMTATATGWRVEVLVPAAPLHGANGMQVDREGRLVGGSMMSGTVFRVDRATGAVETLVAAPRGVADDLAIAPDGTIAWTSPPTGTISMRRTDGAIETLARGLPFINSLFFTTDGRLYAAAVTETVGDLYEIDVARQKPPRVVVKDLPGLNGFEITRDNQLYGPLMYAGKVIRVDLATGAITDVASGFTRPTGVNLDAAGNLYVVDYLTGEVTRLDARSSTRRVIATVAPPIDNLAVSADGFVYVSHPCTQGIEEIDPNTGVVRSVAAGSIGWPGGGTLLRREGREQLLVSGLLCNHYIDPGTGAVASLPRKGDTIWSGWIDQRGDTVVLSSFAFGQVQWLDARTGEPRHTRTGFKAPYAVKLLEDESTILAEHGTGRILKLRKPYDGEPEVVAQGLTGPVAFAVRGRELVVSEADSGVISRVSLDSSARTVLRTGLRQPEGLALLADGRIAIAEVGARRLVAIGADGQCEEVIADNLPIGLPPFMGPPKTFVPTGVMATADGRIFVTSDVNHTVLRLTPLS